VNAKELLRRINAKFAAPAFATFDNVADSTGMANGRADAISMACWKSRGYLIHGFEIKISRSDWLRELKQPEKTERLQKYCDHWWIVVPDASIIRDDLPSPWGLMVAKGAGLHTVVKAPKLTPVPADREFLASLLRTAIYSQPTEPADIAKARLEGIEQGNASSVAVIKKHAEVIAKLDKRIRDFEKASGIRIDDQWTESAEIGKAVAFLLDRDGRRQLPGQVHRLRRELSLAARDLRKVERALKEQAK
jgi:hypothetical protein